MARRTLRAHLEEELSRLRTIPVPSLTQKKDSAEFFLLFSATGVEDVSFIRGDDELKGTANALGKAHYQVPFPDQGPERIPRREILSCSAYTTPSCNLVLLLPANTTR